METMSEELPPIPETGRAIDRIRRDVTTLKDALILPWIVVTTYCERTCKYPKVDKEGFVHCTRRGKCELKQYCLYYVDYGNRKKK